MPHPEDPLMRASVSLPQSHLQMLDRLARTRFTSRSAVLRQILDKVQSSMQARDDAPR